jgi:hypothetical protein
MVLDIFGVPLYTGDVVVFADPDGEGSVTLEVYEIEEIITNNTARATLLSGQYAGAEFYLQDTTKRCALVRNLNKAADVTQYDTLH